MSGVRINAICPGPVRSANRPSSAQGAAFLAAAPMKRLGTVDETKGTLLFLASDASSYMTGSMEALPRFRIILVRLGPSKRIPRIIEQNVQCLRKRLSLLGIEAGH